MAEVTITVDGVQIRVPEGTNVVDAARTAGIAIPVFCYHPRMDAVGMCRMCLVAIGLPRIDRETRQPVLDDDGTPVIGMLPKLQTACTTKVANNMQVYTQTEEVEFAQRGVLEFLLTSHPLDCPVCDKGGECPLQNLTMEWGPGNSRFDYSDKVHFEKPLPLGDLIYLDQERCILCGRCVRFQEEIADDPVLGFSSRGRSWHIISKSNPPFDSKFSGNTTDICPVGALTTSDFRFKARAWELTSIPSLCNLCPVGCNTTLDMRHNEIKRVMPRENGPVNDIWICDKGRFGHHFIESDTRLDTPLIRRNGTLQAASWDEALQLVAEKTAAIQSSGGGEALGGLVGEHLANEDYYLFHKLFREMLQSNNLDHRTGAPGEPADDDTGVLLGVGKGTDLMHLGQGTTVLVVGADPEEEAPLYLLRLRNIVKQGGTLFVANARPTKLERTAKRRLRYKPGQEMDCVRTLLKLVYEKHRSQHLPQRTSGEAELKAALGSFSAPFNAEKLGLELEAFEAIVESMSEAKNVIIMYGSEAMGVGPALAHDLGSMLLLLGKAGKANSGLIPLLKRGNSRGALDMGMRPDKAAGYVDLKQPGLSARQMWQAARDKKLRGMFVLGSDPAASNPAARPALEALEFLVVQDMFLTETAHLADVVLPASSIAEYDATYTNAERRVQRARQARRQHAQARPHWDSIQRVAQALEAMLVPAEAELVAAEAGGTAGKASQQHKGSQLPAEQPAWDYLTVAEVAMDIADTVRGYAGITHEALAKTAQANTWGRQTNEAIFYDGTNYENAEGIGIQCPSLAEQPRAAFDLTPLAYEVLATNEDYPFVLQVQPLLYAGDPLLRDSLLLNHVPAVSIALNTQDAQRLGIRRGDTVQVKSAVGNVQGTARVVPDLPAGSVLIPADLPAAPLAQLQTGTRTRVTVGKVEA